MKDRKQTEEALKELYGDDYDDLIGMEDGENQNQGGNFKNKLTAKVGQWFATVKDKYDGELSNPDSKLNAVKNQFAKLNEEIKKSEVT